MKYQNENRYATTPRRSGPTGRRTALRRPRRSAVAQDGLALGTTIIFFFIIVISGGAMLTLATSEADHTARDAIAARVHYLAEGGVEYARLWLAGQSEPPGGSEAILLGETVLGQGSYTVTIHPEPVDTYNTLNAYVVVSLGQVKALGASDAVLASKIITVTIRTESFAKFAYFTDSELAKDVSRAVWFSDGDMVTGPMHSNTRIHISGMPVFLGRVSSAADSFNYYHDGPPEDVPDFRVGYTLNTPEIPLSGKSVLKDLAAKAASGGLKLKCQQVEIEFLANGAMSFRTYQGNWSAWEQSSLPANGLIYVDGDAIVRGTLSGRVTVVVPTGKNIIIPSDVRYLGDPTDPACTDCLGLIAGQAVVVTKSDPPGADITIHASILVFDNYFYVEDHAKIPVMGKLSVYGGVAQKHRGPIASFDADTGTKLSGYSKDYQYDYRAKDHPPPCYPVTGRYELITWQESPTLHGPF